MQAIVLGSKSVNATGLIRSLGMAGMSVTFMSNYSKIESKYTKNYVRLPDDKSKWIKAIIEYSLLFLQLMMILHICLMIIAMY